MRTTSMLALALPMALAINGCAYYKIKQEPTIPNNSTVPQVDETSLSTAVAMDQARLRASADSVHALALATCSPALCEAIARNEIALGMNETGVMAASRTAPAAWSVRRTGSFAIMVPASPNAAPMDKTGQVMMVQVQGGQAAVISRRGPQGIMVVSSPQDATAQAQARAAAEALVREGDDLVMTNDLDAALNRYDRASVLDPDQPEIEYKAARILDLQLRPQEALMRYQRFLLSMELEKIRAQGEANAKLAEAIALAQQRIVVLERQVR